MMLIRSDHMEALGNRIANDSPMFLMPLNFCKTFFKSPTFALSFLLLAGWILVVDCSLDEVTQQILCVRLQPALNSLIHNFNPNSLIKGAINRTLQEILALL